MESLMTIADVAEKMNLTEAAIRKFVLLKTIPFVKVGAAVRFIPSEVEDWIKEQREAKPENNKKAASAEISGEDE